MILHFLHILKLSPTLIIYSIRYYLRVFFFFFFSGYGHVTPLTKEGKLFCILYALLGIPLTLTLFSTLVERLMIPSRKFLTYLIKRLGKRFHTVNIRLIHILVIVSILVAVFIFIPAIVFTHLESEWDYLDSFYYCFISLTTIGLGDYIPGDSPQQPYRPLYKIAITRKSQVQFAYAYCVQYNRTVT